MKRLMVLILVSGVFAGISAPGAYGQAASQPAKGGQPMVPVLANPDRAPNELHVGVGQVGRPVTGDASPTVDKTMMDLGLLNGNKPATPSGIGTFGTSGLGDFARPNSPIEFDSQGDIPALNLATQPATAPAAGSGAAVTPEQAFTDKLFLQAWGKFHAALYGDCADMLRNPVHAGEAALESRELYGAALVAIGQMSTAGFEVMEAAKADPKNFFGTARRLAKIYRAEPDFPVHFDAAKKSGRDAKTLEQGILWAFYQVMEGSEENDPAVTLTLLHPRPDDAGWFRTLAASLKKSGGK